MIMFSKASSWALDISHSVALSSAFGCFRSDLCWNRGIYNVTCISINIECAHLYLGASFQPVRLPDATLKVHCSGYNTQTINTYGIHLFTELYATS